MVKAKDGSGVFGYKDTPKLPGCDFVMHDPDRPLPPKVRVGPSGPPVPPPSDAVVLFDGKDLSAWQPSTWKVEDGQIVAGDGKLVSKALFGDIQVHAEWMAPVDFKGPWYGAGNNGVTLMDQFEIQIFDSANPDIKLYADGECGAIYGQTPPLVNVCRKAGEWQSFDIFFTAPVFEQGKLVKPARVTVLQNGVVIHLNQEIYGETRHRVAPAYKKTDSVGPISFPAHYCPVRLRNIWVRPLNAVVSGLPANAAAPPSPKAETHQRIEQALPEKATVPPAKPRRLLIFNRNIEYDGHRASILAGSEAFKRFGEKTGAFEATISEDPAVFDRDSLRQFDAVFFNNNIGNTLPEPERRKNLLEFVTAGGGLMGVHGTSVAFTKWQWPPVEDWPEFGHMLGARGANHRGGYLQEPIVMGLDDPSHPLLGAFGGSEYPWTDEIFRFHDPYSRKNVRVLLKIDTEKTDLSAYLPDDKDKCLRADNDYALAWIRNYGKGRVFYSALAHSPHVFEDPKMLRFYLDGAQFVLGDLSAPTTPSAFLTPAVRAQEKLGWRIGMEAYTFHKFTFFETIDKTAELGLSYIGGLCSEQNVSKDIPKDFDQNLTDDELGRIRIKMESAGVRLLTYYVRNFPQEEAPCRKLFEFANKMGIETFMGEPKPEQLDLLDKLANEYAVNIAIHNHNQNISPIYWRPENVLKACEGRSKRIGACTDNGYWLRSGIDPIEAIRILKDRIITVHVHDLHETGGNGHDVPWGTGTAKTKEFLQELHRLGIQPTMMGIEYAHDWFESMPKIAKSIEFFNATTLELADTP